MPGPRRFLLPAALLASVLLGAAACSGSYSPNTYAAAAAQQANPVTRGVVVGVRPVTITPNGTLGAAAGGAAGGVAGSQAPGGIVGSAFGAIAGTLFGGLAGSTAARAIDTTKAWEYIVDQADGKLVSVTQTDKEPFPVGTHVLVIAGKQARIVRDYTKPLPAEAARHPIQVAPPPASVSVTPLPAPVADDPASPGAAAAAPSEAAAVPAATVTRPSASASPATTSQTPPPSTVTPPTTGAPATPAPSAP